ncbi:TlpA disulfide reductase family protein [Mucilaginibacter sp. MD40]|uniref:TlpA family protein disulfide reductase n=1 Tax=Mucilaginibacter sp. MD40 TaxID=2029590 RepID=UPI001304717C|nr:TlpA disulfide reductase family protein [Mucilaginibacter sp. MD40]
MKATTYLVFILALCGTSVLKAQSIASSQQLAVADHIFIDSANRQHSLREFKGKYVYLDIWASWCYPCRKEYPLLEAMAGKLDTTKIKVIGISLDKTSWRWKGALTGVGMKGTQWCVTDTLFEHQLQINSIPRFILIDPAGKVQVRDMTRPSNPATLKTLQNLTFKKS